MITIVNFVVQLEVKYKTKIVQDQKRINRNILLLCFYITVK